MNEAKNEVAIAEIRTDIGYIKGDIAEIKNEIKAFKEVFVTKTELEPLKKVFNWGSMVVGAIMFALIGLVLSNVIPGFKL
jgi:hypothetical protein